MAEPAEAAEEQATPEAAGKGGSQSRRRPTALARKSYAQQFARVASKPVRDRRQRAEIRIHIYNQLLPLLEANARQQARLRSLNRRLMALLTLCVLLLGGAVALLAG